LVALLLGIALVLASAPPTEAQPGIVTTSAEALASSSFDQDDEGWIVVGDAFGPYYAATGGYPGGHIYATDFVIGGVWYWQAPAKFLGDKSAAYGGTLTFDLRQSNISSQFDDIDVILSTGDSTLIFDTPYNPGAEWTAYTVNLTASPGWLNATTGRPATEAELRLVLSSLTELDIRGEYRTGTDTGSLDNVVLNAGSAGPPAATISGQVRDINNMPLAGVVIATNTGLSATTGEDGSYVLSGLAGGTYTLTPTKRGYRFSPPSTSSTVPPNTTVSFVAIPHKQPLLVVHGIQTLNWEGGYQCADQPAPFDGSTTTLGALPGWFTDTYEVWMAYLDSSPFHTASLQENAQCLRYQVDYLYNQSDRQEIVIVAHSMGGLVSRACLSFVDCRQKVSTLYTLGSPHGGLHWGLVSKILLKMAEKYLESHGIPIPVGDGVCIWQQALCQMSTESMLLFNATNYNQRGIEYTFIGGDATPRWPGWLFLLTDGPNDGVVGRSSAFGWVHPTRSYVPSGWPAAAIPTRYWTKDVHSHQFGQAYYQQVGASQKSQAYECIAYHEISDRPPDPPQVCRDPDKETSIQISESDLSQTTVSLEGQLASGQSVALPVEVDTGAASLFSVAWVTGTVRVTLMRPDGQLITPEYAVANPLEVIYNTGTASPAFPPFATYAFTTTMPGAWQMILQAGDVGAAGAGYMGFIAMDTNRILSLSHDAAIYRPGDTATFTATLHSATGGIGGAIVTATLHRPDGIDDTLTLADTGGGVYRTSYVVPDAGGHVAMEVVATGSDGGVPFTRQVEQIWMIAPPAARFAGGISDEGADRNGNGLYDALLVNVSVEIDRPGSYTLAARLTAGNESIASTAASLDVSAPGTYLIQLSFDGSAIREAQANGPYTVADATLADADHGGIPIATAAILHSTLAYTADQFESDRDTRLFLPLVGR
jgi:hypothetical protein